VPLAELTDVKWDHTRAVDFARYITGQVLVVDGGLLVGRY
jgi:hypothetical protein